ncbi:gliding motility-associated C-terminal domain-containing protein [Chitinophagaceae bacterium MMS25-I14]
MKNLSRKANRFLLVLLIAIFAAFRSDATHIFGGELYYTNVSGLQYSVTLVLYGDCAGASFPFLQGATPSIEVYNNNTSFTTMTLAQNGPGVEVTPVCPSQVNNTTCTNPTNPVPGVKRYIYTGTITLNTTSTNWRFDFTGNTGPGSVAGRSGTITNITNPSSSTVSLEATLNNTVGVNSSPTYTTVPTPFFCINKPANYNPGAVDPNGDNLTFALTPGLVAGGGTVTYLPGYTSTQPLAVAAGSQSFSTTNGQLSFTPNIAQTSLVVYKVSEFRNGVLVGTSMREMNFIVLSTCNNNPPGGNITTSSGGNVIDTTNVTVCASQGLFSFTINAGDIDGNNVNLTWAGIPAGAVFNVIGNGTNTPTAILSWNVTNATPGVYTIFITYVDDGCPLSSKQTVAYTITVLPKPTIDFALVSAATCTKKAVFTVTPGVTPNPWVVRVYSGGTPVITRTGVTGTITDSLAPGTYTFSVTNANNCQRDTSITIAPPPAVTVSATVTRPTCSGGNNGSITVTGGGGLAPFTYAIGTGTFSSTNTFTSLTPGTYTLHVIDANNCTKDTTITLLDATPILANVTTTKPPCNHFSNGAITISAYNSVSPYQYALGTGSYQASGTFSGLFSGNYTIHIKNALGCIKDTIVKLPDSVKIAGNAAVTNILCNNGNNGAITLGATGAYPPYQYSLGSGAFSGNNTFTNLTAGTYTLHIQDTELCYFDTTITLTQPTPVTVTAAATNVLCNAAATGTATISGGGGVPPYTYANGAGGYTSSGSFTNLTAGTYTFHVKDANGCIKDTTVTLTQPTPIVISLSFTKPLCVGAANGTITISATGGTGTFTYAIGAGAYSASGSFTSLTAGTYTLHAKDANNCIKDSVFTLSNPPAIVPAVTMTSPLCNGASNGTITLTATGGAPGYTYAIGAGTYGASGSFTGLAAGSYTLHVKDANSCIKDTTVNLIDALPIHANVTLADPPCNHFSNGSITMAAFNGAAPYQYALGTGSFQASGTFSGLFSGSYLIHIKDNNGCTKDTTVILPDSVKIAGTATVTTIHCYGDTTGAVQINASGAFPPYTYAVGTGTFGSTNNFTPLPAGTYTFHVQDTRLCYFDTTITLTQPTRIVPGATVTNVSCFNGSNGTVTLSATGGTSPYTYAVGTGAYSGTTLFNGFAAGTYTFHVKDASNCVRDTSLTITQPTILKIAVATDTPSCNGSANGKFTVTATGGTTPYTYAIGAGAFSSTNVFSGLTAGTYTLHLKDANNCTKDTTIILVQPTAIGVTAAVKQSTCSTLANGKVTLTATGGTTPYQYANGTGSYGSSNVFTPLAAGSYTFHVKDSKGCIKDTTITIADTVFVGGTVALTNAACHDTANGAITITPSGGASPYTYAVNTGTYGSNATISSLGAGSYTVHIKDANGCIHDTSVTITQPTVIVPSVTITQPLCNGGTNGSIVASATGGTPSYSYGIGSGSIGPANSFTGLAAGSYVIHVRDANGCNHDTTVAVAQPAALSFTVSVSNNKCFGDNSGQVTVTPTGGTSPFTYAGDGGAFQSSNVLTGFTAGTHAIHLKDNNGCTKDSSVTLSQPTQVRMTATLVTPTCEGYKDGSVTVSGTGGISPYQYAIGTGSFGTAGLFGTLAEGTYIFHVKDSNSCTHDTTINLVGYPHIVYNNIGIQNVSCFSFKDGAFTLDMGGGNPPFTFVMTAGGNTIANGNTFDSLKTGTYSVHITDSKGCFKDTSVFISQPDRLLLTTTITPNDCIGYDTDGGVTANITGGTLPYSYTWSTNPVSTTPSIHGMANGKYWVWVHDAHNCRDSAIAVVQYDDCCTPFVPNAFTPNGDGKNDVFRVSFKGDIKLKEFIVYNRFGQRVFYTTTYTETPNGVNGGRTEGWDGTYNGQPQDMGVYFYYIKAICGNRGDNVVEFKGDVTLVR